MTLSWPCGDPVLAAYVLQAAAASGQLPYPGLFAAAAAASGPFGILPPRPPPPPHPFPPGSGLCRPTPTLIPPPHPAAPPALILNDRKTPNAGSEEVLSEDETSKLSKSSSPINCKTELSTELKDAKSGKSGGIGSLFQPYLDIEKK